MKTTRKLLRIKNNLEYYLTYGLLLVIINLIWMYDCLDIEWLGKATSNDINV